MKRGGRHGEAGFTLVEMAVASLVLIVALLLAADILDESGRVLGHSVARERDIWTPLASEWLRNDLRTATGVGGSLGLPDEPLVLAEPLGVVVWRRAGSALLREESGGPPKKLLDRVELWQWQVVPVATGAIVVEVEVHFRRASSFLHSAGGGLPQPDVGKVETLHWLVLLRGAQLREGGATGMRGW